MIISALGTPDGRHIAVSYWSGTRWFDATTGEEDSSPPLPLIDSLISSTGLGAGTTADGQVLLFDPDSFETTGELPAVHGYGVTLGFSLDGTRLVVGNVTDGLRLYDVSTGTQLGDAIPTDDTAFGFAFSLSPDGKQLAVPAGEIGVVVWDLESDHWADAACALAGRNLSEGEWETYLADFGRFHQSCVDGRANP